MLLPAHRTKQLPESLASRHVDPNRVVSSAVERDVEVIKGICRGIAPIEALVHLDVVVVANPTVRRHVAVGVLAGEAMLNRHRTAS